MSKEHCTLIQHSLQLFITSRTPHLTKNAWGVDLMKKEIWNKNIQITRLVIRDVIPNLPALDPDRGMRKPVPNRIN
jgi:hypothetical protein